MLFVIKSGQYLRASKVNGVPRLLFYAVPCRTRSTYNEYEYIQQSTLPTMHFQASLPRLPIPKLEDSCKRYLRAQQPILSAEDFQKTTTNVSAFQQKEGPQLQKQLVDQDAKNKHTSYISGPWFDLYLRDRKPIPINYNPALGWIQEDNPRYDAPLVKATNLLISAARFMKSLRAGILEPEVFHMNPAKSDTKFFRTFTGLIPNKIATYGAYLMKAFPLDMSQFNHLFGTSRIPEIEKDRLVHNPEAKHVVVVRRGHFYAFDLLDGQGNIKSPREIAACVNSVMHDKRERNEHPVGILTATERDQWAKTRKHLEEIGNGEVLKKIDTAAFVLALDDEDEVREDFNKFCRMLLHADGANRWFDKSFSLVVCKDGYSGINFEHSWGDGVAVLRFFKNMKHDIATKPRFHPEDQLETPTSSTDVERLDFKIDDTAKSTIAQAVKDFKHWTHDRLMLDHLIFNDFGKDLCKREKISPDAIMQLAFQLAQYKLQKRAVATYESCSTSAFRHGRTETVRSCTNETTALCKAIVDSGSSKSNDAEYKKLIVACSNAHNVLIKEAAMGQGFDRHLFALKNLAEKAGGSVPAIFSDPAYAKINHNILSTSTLSTPEIQVGGFGPVVPDGYGVAYMIQDHRLGSVITSYKEHRDVTEYVQQLQSAFDDIHRILKSK